MESLFLLTLDKIHTLLFVCKVLALVLLLGSLFLNYRTERNGQKADYSPSAKLVTILIFFCLLSVLIPTREEVVKAKAETETVKTLNTNNNE